MSKAEILSKPVTVLAEDAGGEYAVGSVDNRHSQNPNLFIVPANNPDEEDLKPGQGSAYDLTCANSFNAVALPPGFERLNVNRLLSANMRMEFSTNGIGGITELNGIKLGKDGEPEEEEDEKNLDRLRDVIEQANEERKQWAQASHSFAGVEMTGAEWGEFSNELKSNSALRQWLLAKMMKDGKTRGEAEALINKLAEAARIQSIPESQRTEEEKQLLLEINNDREAKTYLAQAREMDKSSAPQSILTQTASNATTVNSVNARADIFEGFSTAPNLSQHHRAAIAAVEPLDQSDAPQNLQIAANSVSAPQPASAGGFEV